MKFSRQAYMALAYLFVLGLVIQVFLAGAGVFGDFDGDLNAHRDFAHVLEIIPVLMLVAAFVGKMRWAFIGAPIALFLLVELQYAWVSDDNSRWIKAIHPTMALVMFAIAHFFAQRAMTIVRGRAALGVEP